jgi:hypothetical protein
MLHARDDYNRIQDPENKIGKDEPVLLLRAQDHHFLRMLSYYQRCLEQDIEPDRAMIQSIDLHIARTSRWNADHQTKAPDMNRGDVVTRDHL